MLMLSAENAAKACEMQLTRGVYHVRFSLTIGFANRKTQTVIVRRVKRSVPYKLVMAKPVVL